MILSASRRTDIPNYYADWFMGRIREGYCCVRNPMNPRQVSRIDLAPQAVDCIVFWTKNPAGLLPRLKELRDYTYYFQFTLTGYGRDIEPNLPDKREKLIPAFRELSEKIGKERVIWRYDPIFVNEKYTVSYHLKAFEEIADRLAGYTEQVVISFVDLYAKIRKNAAAHSIRDTGEGDMMRLAGEMARIAAAACGSRAARSRRTLRCWESGMEAALTGNGSKGSQDVVWRARRIKTSGRSAAAWKVWMWEPTIPV